MIIRNCLNQSCHSQRHKYAKAFQCPKGINTHTHTNANKFSSEAANFHRFSVPEIMSRSNVIESQIWDSLLYLSRMCLCEMRPNYEITATCTIPVYGNWSSEYWFAGDVPLNTNLMMAVVINFEWFNWVTYSLII